MTHSAITGIWSSRVFESDGERAVTMCRPTFRVSVLLIALAAVLTATTLSSYDSRTSTNESDPGKTGASKTLFAAAKPANAALVFDNRLAEHLAERVAACLLQEPCSIYTASLEEIGPLQTAGNAEQRALTLKIERTIRSDRHRTGDRVHLTWWNTDNWGFSLGYLRGWPWKEADLRQGASLLIVHVDDERLAGTDDVALATPPSSRTAAMALDVIRLHMTLFPESSDTAKQSRRRRDRKLLLDRIAALQPSANPFERIYLIEAATLSLAPATAAETLASLMEREGFMPAQRTDIAWSFGLVLGQSSTAERARSGARLAHIAASPDFERARPALARLLILFANEPGDLPQLNAVVAQRLSRNYQKLAARYPRNPAFEATLNRMAGAK